jgi:outer membrane protein assembly factor BamB
VKISSGYSGPAVADNRVYVTDRIIEPAEQERVLCFDAKTGKKLWSYSYDCLYKDVGYTAGPRATVTVDHGRAYALGTMGHLYCFDAKTGAIHWSKDLNALYDIQMPIWGIATAPLIEAGNVIVHIGGTPGACLVALDKITGKEAWKVLDDRASYAAPIAIDQAGGRVVICWTGDRIVGVDPLSGGLLWDSEFKPDEMVIAIATPVFHNANLLVTSFYDGSRLLKVHPEKLAVDTIWSRRGLNEIKTDSLHSLMSTPRIEGNHIYGVDSYGELRCLDLATGDRVWKSLDAVPKARWATIHMVKNGDKTWMFNERGDLIIASLSPEGYREISRAHLIDPTQEQLGQRGGVCWSHPAFANKHIFVRNDTELLCASLALP